MQPKYKQMISKDLDVVHVFEELSFFSWNVSYFIVSSMFIIATQIDVGLFIVRPFSTVAPIATYVWHVNFHFRLN